MSREVQFSLCVISQNPRCWNWNDACNENQRDAKCSVESMRKK
jgi:hypothetical protein